MKNLLLVFTLITVLISGSAVRAEDYGYAPFLPGQEFPVGQLTWGKLADGASCQLRIPHTVKVIYQEHVEGDQDWVYFTTLAQSFQRDAECMQGQVFRLSIVGADTMREKSLERVKWKASIIDILEGRSPIQAQSGFHVGDRLTTQTWFWAVVLKDTQNEDMKFREDDLCRIYQDQEIELVGFMAVSGPYGSQALVKYHGPQTARYNSCPDGMMFLQYIDDLSANR